ncbi:MAG: peptidoglycan endopeptidase [Novosphingobium sp.]
MNAALADAALELVGLPFRLHGREPASGLDCVGVVAEALRRTGRAVSVPEGYSMRTASVARFLGCAEQSGLKPVDSDGDVILCMASPIQPHLLVAVRDGYVHAHASLGRVTFMPPPLDWPVIAQWRLV